MVSLNSEPLHGLGGTNALRSWQHFGYAEIQSYRSADACQRDQKSNYSDQIQRIFGRDLRKVLLSR